MIGNDVVAQALRAYESVTCRRGIGDAEGGDLARVRDWAKAAPPLVSPATRPCHLVVSAIVVAGSECGR